MSTQLKSSTSRSTIDSRTYALENVYVLSLSSANGDTFGQFMPIKGAIAPVPDTNANVGNECFSYDPLTGAWTCIIPGVYNIFINNAYISGQIKSYYSIYRSSTNVAGKTRLTGTTQDATIDIINTLACDCTSKFVVGDIFEFTFYTEPVIVAGVTSSYTLIYGSGNVDNAYSYFGYTRLGDI